MLAKVSSRMTPKQFKAARSTLGLTQKQMAEALGLTIRQITRLEAGETPVHKQTELAVKYLMQKSL